MERCLPVERVGENGSSIGVLDHKKRTKNHKEQNNQISTFRPFKTEKKGRDGKMFTRRARRRKQIVNRSPGQPDMSKKVDWGGVGSRGEKERKKDGMRLKGRAARFKVGPHAPSSRAARDHHARVSIFAPNRHFEPRAAFSHPVRPSPTLGMPFWELERPTRVDTGGKIYLTSFFFCYFRFYFSQIPTPIWRVLCVFSISFQFRDTSCVCVWELVYVCVRMCTNLESPPTMGNLRCDWAPMSNRFYLIQTSKTKWS